MTISSTSAVSAAQSSDIGIEDFLKILTAQLNSQDPLKPVDNAEFVAQIAQFASLEQTRQLNDTASSILTTQSSVQSVGLLGKTVDVIHNGSSFTGTVSALNLASGTPQLTVTTTAGAAQTGIALSELQNVR